MDQRSGDGWICGWFEIFVLCKRNSWAKLWVARRENCFSTEQNHSEYPLQQRGQSGGNESSQRRPLSPRKTDCILDLRSLPGHWSQRFCRELCRPIYNCSSEWRHSGIRLKVGRNFIVYDENPTWWYLGNIVQTKNTRVWSSQDHIRIVRPGDSSKESRTWWSQIEVSSKIYETGILGSETEIMKETPWSRIRGRNSVYERILGDCWQWEF